MKVRSNPITVSDHVLKMTGDTLIEYHKTLIQYHKTLIEYHKTLIQYYKILMESNKT